MVYLDNAATTPVHPKVIEAMIDCLKHSYGNASAKYYPEALAAAELVNQARLHTANLVGVKPIEVIFTSGATESNNLIIRGLLEGYPDKGQHIVSTHGEHSSVKEVLEYLENEKGYSVTYLAIDAHGNINLDELRDAITVNTALVTIGWINSELGTIHPMAAIDQICHEKGVLLHSDATQAVGKIAMNLNEFDSLRFLSLSAHKYYGPKGIGAAIIKTDPDGIRYKIKPLMFGGEQELSLRPGTLPVHNIVGMGVASQLAIQSLKSLKAAMKEKDAFVQKELTRLIGDKLTVRDFENRLPGILSIQVSGIINQLYLKKIATKISASTGSACSINKPSAILKSAGYSEKEIQETLRISFNSLLNVEELTTLEF